MRFHGIHISLSVLLLVASQAAANNLIWTDLATDQLLRGAAAGTGAVNTVFGINDYPGTPSSITPKGVAAAGGFVYWGDDVTDQILRGAVTGSGAATELFGVPFLNRDALGDGAQVIVA